MTAAVFPRMYPALRQRGIVAQAMSHTLCWSLLLTLVACTPDPARLSALPSEAAFPVAPGIALSVTRVTAPDTPAPPAVEGDAGPAPVTWGATPAPRLVPAWKPSREDRWRSALDHYASRVTPGNFTALGMDRAVPFARYLNAMHARIHPFFGDWFLESLEARDGGASDDRNLVTRIELIVAPDGTIKQMGVVRSSGQRAFDIAVLDSVDRARPFPAAPGELRSPDGNVYLHWEFHRDPKFACSTMGARPFILR
jgi:TonB family protein